MAKEAADAAAKAAASGPTLEPLEPVVESAAEWAGAGGGVGAGWVLAQLRHAQAAACFESLRLLPSSSPDRPPPDQMVLMRRRVWGLEKEAARAQRTLREVLADTAEAEADAAEDRAVEAAASKVASDDGLRDEVTIRAKKAQWIVANWRQLNPAAPESERPEPLSDPKALRQARQEVLDAAGAAARQEAEARFERFHAETDSLRAALRSLGERAVLLATVKLAERQAKGRGG